MIFLKPLQDSKFYFALGLKMRRSECQKRLEQLCTLYNKCKLQSQVQVWEVNSNFKVQSCVSAVAMCILCILKKIHTIYTCLLKDIQASHKVSYILKSFESCLKLYVPLFLLNQQFLPHENGVISCQMHFYYMGAITSLLRPRPSILELYHQMEKVLYIHTC